jgi:hypothetical protein
MPQDGLSALKKSCGLYFLVKTPDFPAWRSTGFFICQRGHKTAKEELQ